MNIANNQYRKSILHMIGHQKKKAHRTEIQIRREEKHRKSDIHDMNKFHEDQSPNKHKSHLIWKDQLKKDQREGRENLFKLFTKADIERLFHLYHIKFRSSYNKMKLINDLTAEILKCQSIQWVNNAKHWHVVGRGICHLCALFIMLRLLSLIALNK